ncbi:nonribosomal peptide synthase [Apiospora arundinis]|uniref:Nonribosomal peptide synthase n=1 Tax=Apiospora arundinis TaxID=335852 RepID=A0ABR2I377_9PEZI
MGALMEGPVRSQPHDMPMSHTIITEAVAVRDGPMAQPAESTEKRLAGEIEVSRGFWARTLKDSTTPSFPEVPAGHHPQATRRVRKGLRVRFPADSSPQSRTAWVHGAWALTLSQYQGSDVVFGAGISAYDRDLAIVPQRVTIDSLDASISDFFQCVGTHMEAMAYHSRYHGTQEIQAIDEHCAAACAFQSLVIVNPKNEQNNNNNNTQSLCHDVRGYALAIDITSHGQDNSISIEVAFDPVALKLIQVERLLAHFEHVLQQTSTMGSDKILRDIDHVPSSHWDELKTWNGNVPEPLERTVHSLFESRADLQPDEPAICARDGEWTYAELDKVAEHFARLLRSLGVKQGSYVPLVFEKCGLAIVAMLAVLKAGGASVALDPAQPPQRLASLVAGMGECIVISSAENRDLASGFGRRNVVLDANTVRALSARAPQPRLSTEALTISPDTTAFVLFTSGSTGTPKGILIPHKAFASSIRGHGEVLRFSTGPGSRNFQYTAYTSDVSIGEIFTSLALGSCVCVPSDWDRKNNIAGSMQDFGVNWAFFTPSVATLLGPSEVPSLRTLVFGGETASPENFATWAPSLYLINSFGPAECSIWTHCIPRPVELSDFGSNIGYGVGCATWITDPDDYNRLLPIGAIGELLTDGPNVAAGYLNSPEKTQATFVADPIWKPANRKSMRLYRSGDLARFLPNGMVQFLGRRDHQVKLNGLRVELGEIEHQIRRLVPDEMMVAVDVVNPHPVGSSRILAAFIAPKKPISTATTNATPKPESGSETQNLLSLLQHEVPAPLQNALDGLEDALKNVLPRHMVPAAFVPLGEMPLTASAKTDRKVLKMLASMVPTEELVRLGTRSSSRQLNSPGTVMEKLLARLWSATLGRELDLDVGDSFFKVGGDSLSAMRLVSMAGSHNLKLSVEQVFKSATLGEMAQVVVMGDDSASKDQEGTTTAVAAPFAMVGGAAPTGAIGSAAEYFGVEADEVEDIYPCTPLQEGLLALSQDGRGTYVAQMVHKLSSDIDQARFKEAWSIVLDDWPILRTKFFPWAKEDGTIRMMQAVLRSKPRWKKARSLEEYLKLDARDRMQTGDDMLRMALFKDKKTNEDHFVMTIHHAVFDGWMLALLLTSFRRAYAGMSRPELTPFNVFIQCLEGRGREKSREFWQRYVDGLPRLSWPELPAPDFRPRSNAVQTRTAPLPETRVAQSFTPTTWLRTAFAIILGAYSCTDDVVFASTVYGRASHLLASADTVAGPTLATIPIRVRIPRETRVEDVLAMVQAESAEMLAYEQEGLQTIKQYNSEALATVDAQSLLVVQVDEPHASAPQNVDVEAAGAFQFKIEPPKGLDNGYHNCALVLEATVSENDLHLVATHDDNVLKPDEVQRFLRQMTHVVGQLCGSSGSSDLRIADLDLAAPEDVAEMREWNGVVAEPMRALIHELFHERAQEQPDAEALVSHEGSLTFKELDELSTRLAGHLWTSHGIRPGMHVPLVFEKSLWAVVAMIAVLKVGAANVALNPAQPPDVLQSLVSDVDAEFVLCSERSLSLVQEHFSRYMCVGPSMEADAVLTGENEASVTPDHLAFLLFTSGSTGKPKAIMIDHTAFCSSMRGHGETLCYNKGGRNLQFTAYTSDVSIGEIFTSLTRGATVCIPSDEERMNMNDLAAAMERMRVDWAFLTPSVASLLDPNKVPSLRTLLYGGETATVTNINTWAPRLHLINSFGPAETSIWSHAHPKFTTADIGSDIGWSLGCATWIVDPDDCNRLMPIGAIGELVVEGPNVAAGYYNNPEKTKHAFVEKLSFLGEEKKNRIYRMGDLARWMPGGRVQFLGRKDTQVKLHGLKVDVGGVEDKIRVALGGLGQVGLEVAVEMIENPADRSDSRLVAFVSAESFGQSQDRKAVAVVEDEEALQSFVERTEGLRSKLSAVLPAFTIPSFFVALTSMPLNASAKTDRKRLRALVASLGFAGLSRFSLATRREVQAPRTQMEKRLHNLWSTVMNLGLEDFGVEADFFECGGDSIMAIKLASLARTIKVSLAVQDIYQSPRLADLAALIEGRTPNLQGESPETIPAFSLLPESVSGSSVESLKARFAEGCGVDVDEVVDAYPVTPTQLDLFHYGLKQPGALWMQNVFRIPDTVDVDRLSRAWRRLVLNNDILRTRVVSSEEELLQVVLRSPGEINHTECEITELEAFLASEQLRTLSSGQSLSHVTVVNKEWLVVTLHHILYDAWSLNKLFAQLDVEYSRVSEETDSVDAKQEQRVDLRHFMKVILDQDNKTAGSAFWHNELLGVSTRAFAKETAQVRSSNTFVRHTIKLPQSVGGVRAYRTPAELGYAALGLAFHEQLRTADTIMRMVSTGRAIATVPGIEDLLGPTVNNVPLRLRHSEGTTSTGFITHVRDQLQNLAPWEQSSFQEIAKLHPDAQAACDVAPLVIVQAIDPYAVSPAGIGLERRPQPIFWDNGMPFIVVISPILRGKELEGMDVIVYFADEVVAEKEVRRLVAVLDHVVHAITAAKDDIGVSELLEIKDEDLEKVQDEITVIRAGDQ